MNAVNPVTPNSNSDSNTVSRNMDKEVNMNDQDLDYLNENEANRDPISGEPGAHPLGTGVGAAGAGSIATVIGGVVGGPIGAVVGAVVGSVAGGLAGKGTAESINPTDERQ
jgi:hypothetical protein